MTGLVAAALLFGIPGAGWLLLLRRPDGAASWGSAAESFLFGVGASGTALFALGWMGFPLRGGVFAVPVVLGVVAGLVGGRRWRQERSGRTADPAGGPGVGRASDDGAPSPASRRSRWLHGAIVTLLLLPPLAMTLAHVESVPLVDWDGRNFWLLKGRAILHEGAIDGPFFRGETSRHQHSQYPLMLPLAAASTWSALDGTDEREVRGLYWLVGVALLFAIRGRLRREFGAMPADAVAVVLAWTPQLLWREGGMLTAYSDLALAAFLALGFFELRDRIAGRGGEAWRAGLWLAFAVQAKNEGALLAAIVVGVALVAALARRQKIAPLREGAALVAAPLAAVALLAAWRSRIPLLEDENYSALARDLPARLGELPGAIVALLGAMAHLDDWGLFWAAVLVALGVALARRERRLDGCLCGGTIAAALGLYAAVYAASSGWELHELAVASGARLASHLVGPAAVLLAGLLAARPQTSGS